MHLSIYTKNELFTAMLKVSLLLNWKRSLEIRVSQRCFCHLHRTLIKQSIFSNVWKWYSCWQFVCCVHQPDIQCCYFIFKGQNVLLTADKKTVKLIDFEISKQLGEMTRTMTTVGRGTVYYMAPEVAKHDYYGTQSDIWYSSQNYNIAFLIIIDLLLCDWCCIVSNDSLFVKCNT